MLLLEREDQPGYHTTGRSAAMFMESYGPPGVRARTRRQPRVSRAPPAGFTATPLLRAARRAWLLASPARATKPCWRASMGRWRPPVRGWSASMPRRCWRRVPVLRPERVVAGMLDSAATDIDAHALHQGCLAGLRRAGGTLRTAPRSARAPRWRRLAAGVRAGRAGARAPGGRRGRGQADPGRRAVPGAQRIGLVPHRRSAFTFAAPAGMDCSAWPVTSGIDEEWYFKLGPAVAGSPANADPMEPHDVAPEELDIAIGIDRIQQATTMQIRCPIRTWAGLRSFVPDGELVIGWDRQAREPSPFGLAGPGVMVLIQTAPGVSALRQRRCCWAGRSSGAVSPSLARPQDAAAVSPWSHRLGLGPAAGAGHPRGGLSRPAWLRSGSGARRVGRGFAAQRRDRARRTGAAGLARRHRPRCRHASTWTRSSGRAAFSGQSLSSG